MFASSVDSVASLRNLSIIFRDFMGLWRVCGLWVAARWLIALPTCLRTVFRDRNLLAVDNCLGQGPFTVRLPTAQAPFRICGTGAVSGIREMYVRDGYLEGGLLAVRDGDFVVDLGANMGNFTNMALAHGPKVHVFAVEPGRRLNEIFKSSVSLNEGFLKRVTLISAFIGGMGEKQKITMLSDEQYQDTIFMSEKDLLDEMKVCRIDLLKCDIEGGEFDLLHKNSKILTITKSIAIEIHAFAGDVDLFICNLESSGFSVLSRKDAADGSSVVLATRL